MGVSIYADWPRRNNKEFNALLDKLAREHEGFQWYNAVIGVMRRVVKPMLPDIRRRTRVRTGQMRRAVRTRPLRRRYRYPMAVSVGYSQSRAGGWRKVVSQEYGNRWIRGRRAVERTFNQHSARMVKDFADNWRQYLEDYARNAARRQRLRGRR